MSPRSLQRAITSLLCNHPDLAEAVCATILNSYKSTLLLSAKTLSMRVTALLELPQQPARARVLHGDGECVRVLRPAQRARDVVDDQLVKIEVEERSV